jgi:hypothetical protein
MAVNAISPKYFPLVMSASTCSLPTVQEVQAESEVVFDFTHSWRKNRGEFEEWAARVHALDYAM